MPDEPPMRPATREEIAQTLSFALQFEGRNRVHQADGLMAQITAERLVCAFRSIVITDSV